MRATLLVPLFVLPALAAQGSVVPLMAEAVTKGLTEGMDVASGSWGVDFTTAYYHRGILQEKHGAIAQPYLNLVYDLGNDWAFVMGSWNSLHDGETGSGSSGQAMWYASDFYAELSSSLGERCSLAANYTVYHSPNGVFDTIQEVAFSASLFHDASSMADGKEPLAAVVVAFELDNQADDGAHLGTYAELLVAPRFELGSCGAFEPTLTVPMRLGLSLGDYYEDSAGTDHSFGYLDLGAQLATPLPFLPARLGAWEATLGVHALFLGSATEEFNGGQEFELIGSFSLSTNF